LDLRKGDSVAIKVRIPTNYLNCSTGLTLLNRDLNGINTTSLEGVFAGNLDWFNNSDLTPGSDHMYGWDSLFDALTVSVSSVFDDEHTRIGEVVITYSGTLATAVTTNRLRLSLNSESDAKHKVNVLYGKLGNVKNCFVFNPQYSLSITNNGDSN
jgi:hypothetical protein